MKTFISGFFKECLNGVWKSSMNRLLMFLFGISICGISVLSTIGMIQGKVHKDDIPVICALIGTLISPLLILGGFSLSAKNTDLKTP